MDKRLLKNKHMMSEMGRLICDDHVGSGSSRDVWGCSTVGGFVLKFEVAEHSFQNIAEWDFWWEVDMYKDMKKWLAPCIAISPCGGVLMQARCDPLDFDRIPDKIPHWATDTKLSNWGMLEDKEFGHRPVLLDYGITKSNLSKRLVRPNWTVE